ncbi:M20 family metallo-hydrolase [Mesorhizobium sp. VNQ89]|uniref:M20 family metallo-hydrolase n=1 Tax=Mesorhizobium quangtriensis TaxID=3157709 RepID=UPI0032B84663
MKDEPSETRVDGSRLWSRLMELAQIGATGVPGEVNRQALSLEDAEACALLIGWATEAGLEPAFDSAGNLFLTLIGNEPDLAPLLCGSHLDSQPTGGRFDGALGVLAALEAASTLAGLGRTRRSLIVVAWSNEEGSRFAPGMTGSSVFAGTRDLHSIREQTDAEGTNLGDALDSFLARFSAIEKRPLGFPIAAYLELHIEQADQLEAHGRVIGSVTGIQGKKTWEIGINGSEAHAGTEPMARRKDALQAFARIAVALQEAVTSEAPEVMFTIGHLDVKPNAPSVVPAQVRFRMDLRHADETTLNRLGALVEQLIDVNAPPCATDIKRLVDAPPNTFDTDLRKGILAAAERLGHPAMELLSAAGHDARHLAKVTRAGMIFVPCRAGLSHHPDEWIEPEHAAAGAAVLLEVLENLLDEEG